MRIVKGISRIGRYRKPVVAIGVFDGMHIGHAEIIKGCVRTARRTGGTGMVLTFFPHPQKEESIYSLDHRLAIIASFGIKVCVLVRFNRTLADMSAEDFIRTVIARKIGARCVMVGANFSFGRGLEGNASTLRRLAGEYGYSARIFPVRTAAGAPVSSTRIRRCITSGRFADAERMLGRKVSLMGTVIAGRAVGRSLGYPTANIRPQHEVLPPDGIYAVRVLVGRAQVPGICYKGTRPTFGSGSVAHVEVHLFGFSGDIYGKKVEVRFFRKIREERKFDSPAALRRAITKDIAAAKKILSLS